MCLHRVRMTGIPAGQLSQRTMIVQKERDAFLTEEIEATAQKVNNILAQMEASQKECEVLQRACDSATEAVQAHKASKRSTEAECQQALDAYQAAKQQQFAAMDRCDFP
jgi:chromosome segregation ATPase